MSTELFLLLVLAPIGLLTTVYVIWPLLRSGVTGAGGDAALLNREIVRERRAQLDRELALLPPGSADRDRLILEFSNAALSDLAPQATARGRGGKRRWVTAALVAGLMAIGPLVFYGMVGVPDAATLEFARLSRPQDLPTLVSDLEKRLQAEPQAADGWLLLGRSKLSLGDLAGATAAMERALTVDSPDPGLAAQIRVDLADALAQGASSRLSGRPWRLIQEALQRDGNNQKALALAGAYQVTQGNRAAALGFWEPLLAQLPPGSQQQAQIASFVEELTAGRNPGARAAAEGQPAAQSPPPSSAQPSTQPSTQPSAQPSTQPSPQSPTQPPAQPPGMPSPETAAQSPGQPGPVLRGRVALEPGLAGNIRADDTLFVAVRGVDQENRPVGPPAAVLRARAADLPLDFELSDRQAMSPASKLSAQDRVVVVARISRGGTATGSPGDLEGRSQVVAPDAQSVEVRIDRRLP